MQNYNYSGNDAPSLDLSYLREMVGHNPEFIIEILDVFVEQTPIYIAELDLALDAENWVKVGDSVHKIKPTFSYIGRNDLKDFAQLIETNAREGKSVEEIPALVKQLKDDILIVYEQIKETKEILLASE